MTITLMAAMAAAPTLFAQSTTKLTASKANEYGLIYTLPRTAFEVTIAAEKTMKTPGEFYQYSKKYLNAEPILKSSTTWKVIDGVVNPIAEADENEQYIVTLKGGQGTFIMIDDQNFPVSINDDSYKGEITVTPLPQAIAPEPTILQKPVAQQAVTPEMIQSKSSAKRAELAAAKIYELRANRNEIIAGQADAMPSDGAAMKLALEQISAQEEALTAMFLGTVQTSVEVRTFIVDVPDEDTPERKVVARISVLDGLVDANDLSGDPIYLTVKPVTKGTLPLNEKGEEKKFPKGGVAYRIPGSAEVTLSVDDKSLFQQKFDIAQYGVVFGLDPSVFTNKKAPSYLHFNPLTGSIRELGVIENQ
ncbi:MAG: DUF4831 family protein [Muribaculum sp.]|nr:DUF4831 family protein [Muribaculum sp.]